MRTALISFKYFLVVDSNGIFWTVLIEPYSIIQHSRTTQRFFGTSLKTARVTRMSTSTVKEMQGKRLCMVHASMATWNPPRFCLNSVLAQTSLMILEELPCG